MQIKKDFNSIISLLEKSISNYSWITDFKKCREKVNSYEKNIEIVQKIIDSNNFDESFRKECVHNLDILKIFINMLCLRPGKNIFISKYNFNYQNIYINRKEFDFTKWSNNIDDYLKLIHKTKLIEFIKNDPNFNLKSFLMGIECGMDTNARKNRSGKEMEILFENYLKTYNFEYYAQSKLSNINNIKEIEPKIYKYLDSKKKEKVFDFIVKFNEKIYVIEVNFFSENGSKLDAIANNFKLLSKEINEFNNIKFVWITDGIGWTKSKNELEDAYNEIDYLYTISDLDKNIFE